MCQENATTVVKRLNTETLNQRGFTATKSVTPTLGKQNFLKKNILVGLEALPLIKHIDVGLRNIPKEWLTSRPEGTQGNGTQKVCTLLRNGENFAERITGDVLLVRNERNSPKTISNLSRLVEATISQTFNHYVGIATVANGSFNIYENKDLLK